MSQTPATVLVVDDEPPICENCRKILTRAGHTVACAYNGQDALARMTDQTFDVVVTDLKMSRLGGMELLRRVKAASPDTMVIVITGYSTVSSAVEVMKLGAFDYLPKPFTPDELRAVVAQAVQARQTLRQNRRLVQEGPRRRPTVHQLVGGSAKMKKVVEMIAKVAPTDATVLITGESGTGKELVARALHANSRRSEKVFFAVDCGTLSGNLLESELFGHAKGAFTGAHKEKEGIFQRADGGTVFLDEIGNIDLEVQGKLLRFLESREFLSIGHTTPRKVDIRLILATNQNLEEMVAAGRFRHDFYYRIYVYPIFLPPLRERREDILPIAYHFVAQFARQMEKPIRGFAEAAVQHLVQQEWPGNVRQLRNAVERAVIHSETDTITVRDLTFADTNSDLTTLMTHVPATNEELVQLKKEIRSKAVLAIEKNFLLHALNENNWNITQAARQTGLKRTNFQNMMRKHHLKKPKTP
ncbi:sigma-54-dependent transcriptional regulator [Desulfatitalea alkaliphila]|uniref:Sigma-54 dependent transcriptional regulator n=1 Tax=Desulfatitalea alkaliphila TaxID=2929485 RepID=A0AA41R7A1_9BACT|nr:sigma-54 dependent transcriptional regulator [Desulfatitalea alkaliphila]MCJ8502803.1 sigma-54 dependent transcriptional regulator [Desulfatitalea alkaliphila]